MFKSIQYEEWQQMLPLIGFGLCFIVFLLYAVKAILMKKKHIQHMSNLPLEKEELHEKR